MKTFEQYDALTVPQLLEEADGRKIEVAANTKKADIIALLTKDDAEKEKAPTASAKSKVFKIDNRCNAPADIVKKLAVKLEAIDPDVEWAICLLGPTKATVSSDKHGVLKISHKE